MKEHPILFSGPMVQAILAGKKMQTRRVITKLYDGAWCLDPDDDPADIKKLLEACPYGVPGDRLWVRETWAGDDAFGYAYRATEPNAQSFFGDTPVTWRPSIFMPRWASRITLEVVAVRVERLQSISRDDVCKELGVPGDFSGQPYERDLQTPWVDLWNSINAKRGFGWEKNPWVWVVEFKQVE